MREYLFRGQTRKLGEKVRMDGSKVPGNWVYGGICQGRGDFSIIYGSESDSANENFATKNKHVVYTNTVGQYTGQEDAKRVKIFENDIVEYENRNFAVAWDKRECCFKAVRSGETFRITEETAKYVSVIGNIHDNVGLFLNQ